MKHMRLLAQHLINLDIPVFVILEEELEDILQHSPEWWGTENKKKLKR